VEFFEDTVSISIACRRSDLLPGYYSGSPAFGAKTEQSRIPLGGAKTEVVRMRKTAIFASFLLFILVTISCVEEKGSVAAEPAQIGEKARFEKAKQEYLAMKEEGRNVSEIAPLIKPLREAIQARSYDKADKLLTRIEALLAEAAGQGVEIAPKQKFRFADPYDPVAINPKFGFGVEYAAHGLAKGYAALGADWIKIPNVTWEAIEPKPPVRGKHSYQWKRLDDLIAEYQLHNFDILIVLKSKSTWGMTKSFTKKRGFPNRSAPPKQEHVDSYADFVRSVVERYDADGIDDMPNIRKPILHYEIESEAQNAAFWNGTAQDYVKMLRIASAAVKDASPDAETVLSGINLADFVYDMPTEEQFQRRIDESGAKSALIRQKMSFIQESLSAKSSYGSAEFHSLGDYRSIAGTVDWIRTEMRKSGDEKPLWIGDAISAPPLMAFGSAIKVHPFLPKNGKEIHKSIKNERASGHSESLQWYRARQADDLVKKFVVAMNLGLDGIMMGNTHDWPNFPDKNLEFAGLVDASRIREKPYPIYAIKGKRPVSYTFQFIAKNLKGADTVQRIRSKPDTYIYKFIKDGKPLFVCWAEVEGAGEKLAINAPAARVLESVGKSGKTIPKPKTIKTKSGILDISLSSSPVFIEPID
jgi:hypothetical protein